MNSIIAIIGILIAIGAAVVFLLIGALTLFGGTRATQDQVVPSFRLDSPGLLERLLTLLSVWGPVLLIAALCLLGAIQIVRVALGAI